MALLQVTGSITVPAGKTLSSASLRVVYLEEYSDGTARYARIYDLAYDTVNGRWKPAGTANGTTAYIPGADLGDPGPVATFSETQNYSDNSSQSRQWTQNVLATAADTWDYTALMPDYWQLGTVATATLYPAATGRLLRYGAGAPNSSLGVVGDFYIDTTNSRLYGPKLGTGWGSYISIIGPTGPTGATGATGPTGPAGANGVFSGSETIETVIETSDYLYFTDVSAGNAPKRITAANAMSEIVEDRVAGLIVAGANTTVTYNDAATPATLTIASTASQPVTTTTISGNTTWTLPTGAKAVQVTCIGAGGGGGSGSKDSVTTTAYRGGGGGGGARVTALIPASAIGTPGTATVSVTIGAKGTGGAARTTTSDGANGTAGGTTSFGSFVAAPGGGGGGGGLTSTTSQGAVGDGGLQSGNSSTGSRVAPYNGGQGSSQGGSMITNVTVAIDGAGGGGAGGAVLSSAADTATHGAIGSPSRLGSNSTNEGNRGTAGATPTAATAGTSRSGTSWCGGGGGGGFSSVTASQNAGTGGAGGLPGGGGGGGGAKNSSTGNSGAGGDGADGEVIIVVYY